MSSADSRRGGLKVALLIVLVILILLLAGLGYFITSLLEPVGSPTESELPAGLEWVRSIYGYGPLEDQQFVAPDHTTVAADGTIWVSDTQLNSIFGFSPDGTLRQRIDLGSMSPDQPWTLPKGIGIADNGDLFVCAANANLVIVVTETGEFVRSWNVEQPLDCEVAGDRVYVTGPAGVSVFSLDGETIGSWGGRGGDLTQLDMPQGIAVGDDGTVYVSDTLNARVKAFTGDGVLLWTSAPGVTGGGLGMGDTGESQETTGSGLQIPAGITIDGVGRLCLVDPFGFDIVVMDAANGEVLGRYGDFGGGDGLFAYPTGIDYDVSRDWFAVADNANQRVQIVRIPSSGNAGVAPSVRRALVGPVWICAVPLLLLLAFAVILSFQRRRGGAEERVTTEAENSGE